MCLRWGNQSLEKRALNGGHGKTRAQSERDPGDEEYSKEEGGGRQRTGKNNNHNKVHMQIALGT